MGRTIPSWRMVVEAEITKMKKFQEFLPANEKTAFNDLLLECKLYAPYASCMASTVKETPILISMLFGQHKRIIELERKIVALEIVTKKNQPNDLALDARRSSTPVIA